jgi:ATP-binding cassette subfamily C protein LapB
MTSPTLISPIDIAKPNDFYVPYGYLTLGTLCIVVLSLALPIMTLQIYDRILPNAGAATLTVLTAGVCIAIIMETVLRLCRDYMIKKTASSFDHDLSCCAFGKIIDADLSVLHHKGVGSYMHRMAAAGRLKEYYSGQAYITVLELVFIPIYLGFVFYISVYLGLIPVLVLSVFSVISIYGGIRLRHIIKNREESDDKRFDFLIEALEGIHLIKANALEPFFQRRYEQLEETSAKSNYILSLSISKMLNLSAVFSNIMIAAIISVGAWCVLNGQLTTGSLIACLLLSGRIMQPVQRALGLWVRHQDYQNACVHVASILQTKQSSNGGGDISDTRQGTLQLKDIVFQYGDDSKPVLDGVNLSLKRGQVILLSGDFGAGKTTLMNIIAGLYPPQSGTVLIDGKPISDYTAQQLATRVAYIKEKTVIFRGTVRDNMTCFGQIPENQVRDVARLLKVDVDIAALPGGFDTFLSGDNTDTIPPGLKQRIAIVRALAAKPKIIIYDNADQSLDKSGYQTIYNFLARLKGKATLILVSNDHNIQTLADDHYVLTNGTLVRQEASATNRKIIPYKELSL